MFRGVIGVVLLLALTAPARADRVSTLSRRLSASSDYKVRISAALVLAKTRDDRAITALSRALLRDDEPTVRRVAATSIARQLSPRTKRKVRARAIAALRKASRRDRDRKVRRSARTALTKIERAPAPAVRRGPMVVSVSKPGGRLPRGSRAVIHAAVARIVRKHVPREIETVRGESLDGNGYAVSSKVASLTVQRQGKRAQVRCSVSVRIAPFGDGKERWSSGDTATASGSGQVTAANTRTAIERAASDCVIAVIEQVTQRRVGPFLAANVR